MTQELSRKRPTFSDRLPALTTKASWHRLALAAVLILSAFLNLFRLPNEGYSNTYYAAAVKDMLASWHNFFFVSFDAGFVTVDKPPLGFWIQALSARLFGFHGWSLLLPQALAGVVSAALLYHLVRRAFGTLAGLVAALALALTPISVATDRSNDVDSLLVLTVLLAAWALILATETGRLRWLLACALVVGLGFNIKMTEVFLVLPAFYLLYLVAAPLRLWQRMLHLGLATVVLLAVSLSWALVVDATPADQRPYVGSSSNNSELNLIVGWNGLSRLPLDHLPGGTDLLERVGAPNRETMQQASGSESGWMSHMGREQVGDPGPLRLLDEQLAGQAGWLLPLAVVGLLAASWQKRPRLPLDRRNQAILLWGTWFLTQAVFFSVAARFGLYYLVMLAPAIAALVGAGVAVLWKDYRSLSWRGWLLPLVLLGIAALHTYIILAYYNEGWSYWLTPAIVGGCVVSALGLIALRLRPWLKEGNYPAVATAVGVLSLLIAPTAWATYTVWQGNIGMSPRAGPQTAQGASWGGFLGDETLGEEPGSSSLMNTADPALLSYLLDNKGDAKYLVADQTAFSAAPIILNTDQPVISTGGFMGRDPVFTTDELADLVHKGDVRFFLIPDREQIAEMMSNDASSQPFSQQSDSEGPSSGMNRFLQTETTSWIQDNCQQIPQELWQLPTSEQEEGGWSRMIRAQALYDCALGGR